MSDHLPECYLSGPPNLCPTCEALRACEQRLTSKVWKASGVDVYRYGYTAGLAAARDAVAALPGPYGGQPLIERAAARDAIDALRGES